MKKLFQWVVLGGLLCGSLLVKAATSNTLTGAGSTFIYPLLSQWSAQYKKETGVEINYQAIGSGGGISQIKAGTVDFAATDKPLTAGELAQNHLRQFPMAIGGIVLCANVEKVTQPITLDGPLLADIFLGKVTQWNDPRIQALNKELTLPAKTINLVYRADSSGTTFNFTHYLSAVNPEFAKKIGVNTAVAWPKGMGAKGNAGVANSLKNFKNSVGYVEYAYAKQNKLTTLQLKNAAGTVLAPAPAVFAAAAKNAKWSEKDGYYQILTNQPGKESWPIVAATFVLIPSSDAKKIDEKKLSLIKGFVAYAYQQGKPVAEALDYIPIPESLYTSILAGLK